jgi:hypothetical protein
MASETRFIGLKVCKDVSLNYVRNVLVDVFAAMQGKTAHNIALRGADYLEKNIMSL